MAKKQQESVIEVEGRQIIGPIPALACFLGLLRRQATLAGFNQSGALLLVKLEALIKAEIGIDDGRELPDIPFVTWTIDRVS